MILLTTTLLAFAWVGSNDATLLAAGLEFEAPPGFERASAEAPFVFEFMRRNLATEVARGRLFLVPIESTAALNVAADRARTVAARALPWDFADIDLSQPIEGPDAVLDKVMQVGVSRNVLAVRKVGERYIGLALDMKRLDDDATVEEVLAAFRAAAPSTTAYPSAREPVILSYDLGLRGTLPHAFRSIDSETRHDESFEPAWHLGLNAEIILRGVTDDLEFTLEDSAARIRDAGIAASSTAILDRFEPMDPPSGFTGAFRIGFNEGTTAREFILFETPRLRFVTLLRCSVERRESLRVAFDRMFMSLSRDPFLVKSTFGIRVTDHESGFSLTPPTSFGEVRAAEGLVSYVDTLRRPPAARLTVRLAENGVLAPNDADAAIQRALARARTTSEVLAADGWTLLGEPIPVFSSGTYGARYSFHRTEGDVLVRDQRTIFFGEGRSFEMSVVAVDSEFDERKDLFIGVIGSFRIVPRVIPLTLGNAVTSKDGRVTIEPPDEWRTRTPSTMDGAGTLELVPANGEAEFELITGVDAIPDAAPLVGPAELYRDRIERELTSAGYAAVRVERTDKANSKDQWTYRVAYSRNGVPMKELRFTNFTADGVVYAAARCPAAHFTSWKTVFERSIRTLRANSTP